LHSGDFRSRASLDPRIVYGDDAVAHSRDQVHEEVITPRLREPYRIGDLNLKPIFLQNLSRPSRGFRR
jgi:hypothetical protein